MKKLTFLFVMICLSLAVTGAFAQTQNGSTSFMNQSNQRQMMPPMDQNGQNGQFNQGQMMPPMMNRSVVESDDTETVSLLAEADSNADVLESITNGTVVEILEISGDYVKVSVNGVVGYILSDDLSDDMPEPPAKPEDGEEPPAKPEDGSEPPAPFGNMQQPPAQQGSNLNDRNYDSIFQAFARWLTGNTQEG